MTRPATVKIVEVGPRDGLQNEAVTVPVDTRVDLIERLVDAGLQAVEAGSFVSPKWVPQMAGTDRVLAALAARDGVSYPVLVPNQKGLDAALAAGAGEIAVFGAASETFSQKNINCTVAESLQRFAPVVEAARAAGLTVRGYVSCVLGCPYEGAVAPERVAEVARRLIGMGCYEVSLGDTIGVGTPDTTKAMIGRVARDIPVERLAVHFHDTYGQAIANLYAALDEGVTVIDAAVAGLGGCPYANRASGNVATEDVVYMLDRLAIDSGVDLPKLAAAGAFICAVLGRETGSKVAKVFA